MQNNSISIDKIKNTNWEKLYYIYRYTFQGFIMNSSSLRKKKRLKAAEISVNGRQR